LFLNTTKVNLNRKFKPVPNTRPQRIKKHLDSKYIFLISAFDGNGQLASYGFLSF
jgi:hypothetical protein